MQSFIHDNYTTATARHKSLPTTKDHWTKSQLKHSSALNVRNRPLPENVDEVSIAIRRAKIASAWSLKQSCDTGLWTDVCNLYAMIVAVEKDCTKFAGLEYVLGEVDEGKRLMEMARVLSAVETIEAFHVEEWKKKQDPSSIRRGSLVIDHSSTKEETPLEAKVRHVKNAEAWSLMNKCDKNLWTAACHYHEEQKKKACDKLEKLDAACWVLQDFNTKEWKSQSEFPKSMRHATSLTSRACVSAEESGKYDQIYRTHKQRLIEAWEVMQETNQDEWLSACKKHEDILAKKGGDIANTVLFR